MSGIVIIGAGHAAGQAAASLRQEKYEGDITLIGDEAYIPYQRPPLSKQYLAGEHGTEKVFLRPEKFYSDKNITLRANTRATAIDPDAHTVTLEGGEMLDYEKLLLTTGSRVREIPVPGADLAGVHYLRTIADVDAIREGMAASKNVVVVGGGYIGLEVAAVCIEAGLSVTVLEMEDRILQRVTTPRMSDYYHSLHTGRGVTIRTNTAASAFVGDGQVTGVQCGDEVISADLVVVGIGILPNVELAEDAGLACDDGIVVDDHGQTSNPDIYAAGDCTNHPNPILNKRLRLESVPNAMDQARIASANMLGGDRVYSAVPWFWSDQYELKLQMVGFSSDGDEEVVRGDVASDAFAIFYLKDKKVVAVDAVNSMREFMMSKKLIGVEVDTAKLADPEVNLKDLT